MSSNVSGREEVVFTYVLNVVPECFSYDRVEIERVFMRGRAVVLVDGEEILRAIENHRMPGRLHVIVRTRVTESEQGNEVQVTYSS